MQLEQAIRDFLSFLRRPVFGYKCNEPLDFITAIKLYAIIFFVELVLFIPISTILGMENIPHAMEDLLEKQSLWTLIGLAVIMAPIVEEFLFRFHLKYAYLTYLFLVVVSLLTLGYGLSFVYPSFINLLNTDVVLNFLKTDPLWVAPIFTAFIGLVIYLYRIESIHPSRLIGKLFPFVFYLTVLIFALLHISNFALEKDSWYLAPLMVLPQFILGLYLGYIRVRNNITYSIFIHAFNNAIPILLVSLGSSG